jgi:glutathione synthase/RimK-type ligase-like ATP-grasp enzyme
VISLVTARVLDEPDLDIEPLAKAISDLGQRASIVAWDDPRAELGDVTVLRSTWNYVPVRDEFCAWVDAAAKRTRIFNPPEIVRWSTDKSYLRDLEARGVPIVPTRFDPDVGDIEWNDVVIKPRISAASFATRRFRLDRERESARAFLAEHDARGMMVQPYMKAVDSSGERSLVWIDGAITHAVRKSPRFSDGNEDVSAAVDVEDDERAVALHALEPFENLLYARVDLVRDADGNPRVMELELVEPSLFLLQHPPALERFARAIVKKAV